MNLKIILIMMMSLFLSMIFNLMMQGTQKKLSPQMSKWTPFECGFNSMNPSHIPFSFQFFLVAILFLIFDVEISLILSYPMEPYTIKNYTIILLFLWILTIGLIYEWQKGKINWSK